MLQPTVNCFYESEHRDTHYSETVVAESLAEAQEDLFYHTRTRAGLKTLQD